ncbi:MAG: DUF1501 domain-containing protein [Lentisphaeraceae bacterium]|nr:DUF1501 domain-containing protein [Lentisphaeraceae bacterium]
MKNLNKANEVTRRRFVSGAAGSLLGVSYLSQSAFAKDTPAVQSNVKGTAKSVIYLYMSGGMSHLDTFDIKPDNPEVRGDAGAIKTNADGVRISKFFPKLATQMDKVAIINSLTTTQGAHEEGRYIMHTSYEKRGTIQHPELGAWASKLGGKISKTLPSFVKVGGGGRSLGGGYFEPSFAALPVGDPKAGLQYSTRHRTVNEEVFNDRLAMLQQMNGQFQSKFKQKSVGSYSAMYKDAVKLMTSEDLQAFDISKEDPKIAAKYGEDRFGQGVLLARRLVEKGVKFVEVNLGGWDNHNNIYDGFTEKAGTLDTALGTLLEDLSSRGLLDSTLVVLATEFGRTPKINQNKGRDHYPKAFSGLLAGGGIKGGQIYGKTDTGGMNVVENKVKVQDFNATIATALGLPIDQVLFSPSGRPFQVAHKGKPVTQLF